MSNKLYMVLDHIEGEQPDFNTLKKAKKYIKNNYISVEEGIHPDIDNMLIVKVYKEVKVIRDYKVTDQEVYNVKFKKVKNE